MKSNRCYSQEEQIHRTGFVVERFSEIEGLINTVIFDFISPTTDAESFVGNHLLDNSVVSFASKAKLLLIIDREKNAKRIDREKLFRLLSIRNAFAHNNVGKKLELADEDPPVGALRDIYFFIESIKSDGAIKRVKRDDAYAEFIHLCDELQPAIEQLLSLVRSY